MNWNEAQAVIRQHMKAQPRGYQAALARQLGTTPGFVNHLVTGHKAIPMDQLDTILDTLHLTYDVILREALTPQGAALAAEAEGL